MGPPIRCGPPRTVASNKAGPNFEPRSNLGSKSLLLDLLPECRNEIYDFVAQQPLKITVHRGTVVPHPLACTCRLVRADFLPVFTASGIPWSTTITAHGCNFDLRKPVTFINGFVKDKNSL